MNPRTEPLLWIQLLGLAVLPLEALLILLALGGSDPGPVPWVEELLCWSLGGVAPALLLWRRPADVWSLLLAQIPARGRRDLQRRLSRLQSGLPLALVGPALGCLALLPLVIRLDQISAMAAPLWRGGQEPRLVALLLAALLLGLMLWQWQQVVQSIWLLSRSVAVIEGTSPLTVEELGATRLSLGIPLLLPSPLSFGAEGRRQETPASRGASEVKHASGGLSEAPVATPAEPPADPATKSFPGDLDAAEGAPPSAIDGSPGAIEPEQATTEEQGPQLDRPIA